MLGFVKCTAALALLAGQTMAGPIARSLPGPTEVTPGGINDVIVTKQNTLNGSFASSSMSAGTASTTSGALTLEIVNNLSGATDGQVNAYVLGKVNGDVAIMQSDGSWYFPPATTSVTPLNITVDTALPVSAEGSTTTITIPSYLSAGRVYLSDGELTFYYETNGTGGATIVQPSATNPSDPSANINWGFVELTNTEPTDEGGGLYANLSYVDFVGLILGLSLTTTNGSVQTDLGLSTDAVNSICTSLVNQTSVDGEAWASLCQTDTDGNYLRVIAPYDYISTDSTAFSTYFDDYVSSVWSTYSTDALTILPQNGDSNISCTSSGTDTLTCEGSSTVTLAQPSSADIFGCATGPFLVDSSSVDAEIVPRLCAAFDRATLLLDGGNVQPSLGSDYYYTVSPCNYYSKFVHENELDGKGYAFAYDDVNPTGSENASGELVSTTPETLTITVGGASSS